MNTFDYRGGTFDVGKINNVLNQLRNDQSINARWENYQKNTRIQEEYHLMILLKI